MPRLHLTSSAVNGSIMKKIRFLSFIILFCFNCEFFSIKAQECGKRKSEPGPGVRIFGGEIAEQAEWPWNVALIHRQEGKFFCGGTLISAMHVLSAAHCFQYKGVRELLQPNLVEAQLGKFNLSIENETNSEALLVWEIVIHPDWKFDQEKYDADLSIVVLERKVTLSLFIQPICLPKQSDDVVTGTGTVVGWGKSNSSGATNANVPSKLEVPAIDPATCYTTFPQLASYSSIRMFCGGYINLTKAPCLGDSGGGFYFFDQNEDSWEISGIVSGSVKTIELGCDINKFSLFTHVAKFADWIKEKAKEAKVMNEAMTVDWKFFKFRCLDWGPTDTLCFIAFKAPMTNNSKIRADFSSHKTKKSSIDVTHLNIDFSPTSHVLSGIGEEFPNLKELWIEGDSIKFMERQNFANLTQLDFLKIWRTSVDFFLEDLLSDLPNLSNLAINECRQLKRLPEEIFMSQKELKMLTLYENGLTILQRDLFKHNLKLEELYLWYNNLIEINVDFTRLPAIKKIYLRNNLCVNQEWKLEDKSIQFLQDEIDRNCQPARSV